MNNSIAFIGGGNMATSLIAGLLANTLKPEQILVSDPDTRKRAQLEDQCKIKTTGDNADCLSSDTIILAVKPQMLQQICRTLASTGDLNGHLFISIVAGIKSDDINRWLGENQAIVRCMPNTPSLVGYGATALYANNNVSDIQKSLAETILQAVGISLWVTTEKEIDAVTAVSGSGPAYFFLLMEAMQKSAETLGLSPAISKLLTIQTALGAAKMADDSDVEPAVLRQRVTSRGGTTEQAILSFESAGYFKMVQNALQAANDRSITLAEELGKDN